MRWTEEPIDPSEPGVRRFSFALAGELPPDLAAHLERLEAREAAERAHRQRLLRRRTVVSTRRLPPTGIAPVYTGPGAHAFPLAPGSPVRIELANARTYPTGIAFDLVAHATSEQSAPLHQWVNLGPQVGTKRVGRIYLGLVLPDGSIVTNKKSLAGHAPENSDTTTPWLYGGPVHREPTRVAATYFLSPRPEPGEYVAITLSYKEIGINSAAELVVDSERFAPVEQPHDD